jgi:toxin ParE1/3/4
MSLGVHKRLSAERDIEECFVYIAENDLDIAVSFLVAVEDTLEKLSGFPFLGRVMNTDNPRLGQIRIWHVAGFDKYLLFYQVHEDILHLIRVVHASRDLDDLF